MTKSPKSQANKRTQFVLSKPKQPLTAFNLFFQVERKRILEGTDHLKAPLTVEEIRRASLEHKLKGKRPHRKSHGKIGFRELACRVANRWKQLDSETRLLLSNQAFVEKQLCTQAYENSGGLTKKTEPQSEPIDASFQPAENLASAPESHPLSHLEQMHGSVDASLDGGMLDLEKLQSQIETKLSQLSTLVLQAVSQQERLISATLLSSSSKDANMATASCSWPSVGSNSSLLSNDWCINYGNVDETAYAGQTTGQRSIQAAKDMHQAGMCQASTRREYTKKQDSLPPIPLGMIVGYNYLLHSWDPKKMDTLFMDD